MEKLHRSRCINHEDREAVARCPDCGHFFCRECITEHDGQIVCAVCLQRRQAVGDDEPAARSRFWGRGLLALRFVCGLVALWLVVYTVGQVLLAIPSEFHSGEVWGDF